MDELLSRAKASQQAARDAGFDWPNAHAVIDKISEEILELKQAIEQGEASEISDEFGDVLLAVLNLSLHLKLDINHCLDNSLQKFESRYTLMRQLIDNTGLEFDDLTLSQKENFWQQAKRDLYP